MNEASKTLSVISDRHKKLLQGKGIDIGSGPYPVVQNAEPFDVIHGDADNILDYVKKVGEFDFVFSSHCLEHMKDPYKAISDWWKLVRPGGAMIFIIPDEDLYEQGYWPSIFNGDHKHTFTISKMKSWSPVSINVIELVNSLGDKKSSEIYLMDNNYDRSLLGVRIISSHRAVRMNVIKSTLSIRFPFAKNILDTVWKFLRQPVDQTLENALAQIFVVVYKS